MVKWIYSIAFFVLFLGSVQAQNGTFYIEKAAVVDTVISEPLNRSYTLYNRSDLKSDYPDTAFRMHSELKVIAFYKSGKKGIDPESEIKQDFGNVPNNLLNMIQLQLNNLSDLELADIEKSQKDSECKKPGIFLLNVESGEKTYTIDFYPHSSCSPGISLDFFKLVVRVFPNLPTYKYTVEPTQRVR